MVHRLFRLLLVGVSLQTQALGLSTRSAVRVNTVTHSKSRTLRHVATESSALTSDVKPKPSFPTILWKFTRPHTIIGSAMAIPSLHFLAAPSIAAALSPLCWQSMLYAMIPSLLMNLYITGLNQITDVEIDRINKPDLPIAAGLLSMKTAIAIVSLAFVGSVSMGIANPVFGTRGLNSALWASALFGTVYSLPPLRLKRFPIWAAFCIVAVRGLVINASFFAHAQAAAFQTPTTVIASLLGNAQCLWSSIFFAVFGLVIALMKDVPDVLGDQTLNIRTFSVRLGQKTVFMAMRNLLTALFWGSGAFFLQQATRATSPGVTVARVITGMSAVLFGWSVRKESQGVDATDSDQVYSYYMHLWKLFYGSYLILPFAM
ncbi:homogentisate phytyltransferase / homogentisate geranylgeranyltransferase [Fistulifera solaris]|uniref:Homogentisate phytyltransferase / homogentisate geranylgeranyltransferase n=1 Tax=Fistulifera solaris TaxID=1519565 RepID=A0A1Z5JVY9_FISSO|nr:homogentisate phytyltransferase / homogentisate geranylgeranyltransferase [Fistulifera solaris]|eukprot:GAX18200.1 homogentisate phytyltransferase / homogentisate geranylgeranyltransferase [Fistulifera solaris]